MNKSKLAEEICEELGLDYYEVYNEDGANVTKDFLEAVHEDVCRKPVVKEMHHDLVDTLDQYHGEVTLGVVHEALLSLQLEMTKTANKEAGLYNLENAEVLSRDE